MLDRTKIGHGFRGENAIPTKLVGRLDDPGLAVPLGHLSANLARTVPGDSVQRRPWRRYLHCAGFKPAHWLIISYVDVVVEHRHLVKVHPVNPLERNAVGGVTRLLEVEAPADFETEPPEDVARGMQVDTAIRRRMAADEECLKVLVWMAVVGDELDQEGSMGTH